MGGHTTISVPKRLALWQAIRHDAGRLEIFTVTPFRASCLFSLPFGFASDAAVRVWRNW